MKSLAGQVAIVTGASSGIGAATVKELVRAGTRVVLTGRRKTRLDAVIAELSPDARASCLGVDGDLTHDDVRRAIVERTLATFGRIDLLVNNAGYGQRGPLERVSIEAVRRNYETNVFSLLALTQLVLPHFRERRAGRVINIGSVAGRIARPMTSVYDSTKHALEALSAGLRGELAPFGVQVVVIRPGFILTEFIEAANVASQEVMADLGPYARYDRDFRGDSALLRRIAGQPRDIARLVLTAATARRPRTHYAGPAHARFFLFVNWLLPARAVDWLVRVKANAHADSSRPS